MLGLSEHFLWFKNQGSDQGSTDHQMFDGRGPVRDFQFFLDPGPIGFGPWIPGSDIVFM